MTKSQCEKAAERHANKRCPESGEEFIVWNMCKEDFIAGARALLRFAKKASYGPIKNITYTENQEPAPIVRLIDLERWVKGEE